MRQKGIISLTALCMLVILALMIMTVQNIVARQADIVRLYKVENQLQLAAEKAIDITATSLIEDSTYNGHLLTDEEIKNKNIWKVNTSDYVDKIYVNDISVHVYLYKYKYNSNDGTNIIILIATLAEMENFTFGKHSVYRKMSGYIEKIKDDAYQFKGYIY